MVIIAKILLNIVLILLAFLSVGIYLFWRYPLELLSHFRVYYFLLVLAIAIALLICWRLGLKWRISLYLSLAVLGFNSVYIIPWYLPNSQLGQGESFRLLEFNINMRNTQWDIITSSVLTKKPDVAVLIEISPQAMIELQKRLNNQLPFFYRTTGGGITIFSRFPLISPRSENLGGEIVLITDLQINSKKIHLIASHPPAPTNADLFRRRNSELAAVTQYIQTHSENRLLLLGDFNVTPWSPYYRRLIQKTKLLNTRKGFGLEPSWIEPTTFFGSLTTAIAKIVKIPIDHILISRDFKVVNCKTYPEGNSDHRILISDLKIS